MLNPVKETIYTRHSARSSVTRGRIVILSPLAAENAFVRRVWHLVGTCRASKVSVRVGDLDRHWTYMVFWTNMSQTPKRQLDRFSRFASLTRVTNTHGLRRRVRRTASSMDTTMGKEPNSGWAEFVAPITRPCRADAANDSVRGLPVSSVDWRCGRALDLQLSGRGFESQPVRFHAT